MFNTFIDMFSRAQQNKALTANERAIIKAVKGALYGVLIDIVPQLLDMVGTHKSFNFSQSALSALAGAFILALLKLWSAQSDPEIGVVLDALAQQKERQALDALSTPTPADGTIPVWQITIPAVKSTSLKVTVPTLSAVSTLMAVPPLPSQFHPLQHTLDPHATPTMEVPIVVPEKP